MPDLVNMAVGGQMEGAGDMGMMDAGMEAVPGEPLAAEGEGMEGADYPFGLNISLTQEDMSKLGLDPAALHAGDEINIRARAKVSTALESEAENMVSLQITDMAVDQDMGFEDAFDEAVGMDMGMEEEDMGLI